MRGPQERDNRRLLPALLTAMLLGLGCQSGPTALTAPEDGLDIVHDLPTSDEKGAADRLRDVLAEHGFLHDVMAVSQFLTMDLNGKIKKIEEGYDSALHSDVLTIVTEDRHALSMDTSSGDLLLFSVTRVPHVPETVSQSEGLGEAEARERAEQFLELLGIEERLGDAHGEYTGPRWSDDRVGGSWRFSKSRTYRGVICPFSHLAVRVNAYRGTIYSFISKPLRVPQRWEENIGPIEALSLAKSFASHYRSCPVEKLDFSVPDKMVGLTYVPSPDEPQSASPQPKEEPRLVWAVLFNEYVTDQECVFVDCATGELLAPSVGFGGGQ